MAFQAGSSLKVTKQYLVGDVPSCRFQIDSRLSRQDALEEGRLCDGILISELIFNVYGPRHVCVLFALVVQESGF